MTEKEIDQKKERPEVQTFSVPFALEEIKEDISINSNISTTKLSKEQIIKQAFNFHSQGNLSEAEKYYQLFINQGFKDHRVFSNYGVILRDLGKLKEAELSYSKAIEMKPDYAIACCNLGNIKRELGNLKEAELLFKRAIRIKPDNAIAYSNLGTVLRELGNLQESNLSIRKAIRIKPDYAIAYANLGTTLRDLNNFSEAEIFYRKAIKFDNLYLDSYYNLAELLKNNRNYKKAFDIYLDAAKVYPEKVFTYSLIVSFLNNSDLIEIDKKKIEAILYVLLERDDVNHRDLFNTIKYLYNEKINRYFNKTLSKDEKKYLLQTITSDKLINKSLRKITFRDIKWEKLLTEYRENLINMASMNIKDNSQYELEFIISLAKQCFLNEYIYSCSLNENKKINSIIDGFSADNTNEIIISILACYLPLYKIISRITFIKSIKSSNKDFLELLKIQIAEPIEEIKLSKTIKKLGSIKNNISQKVKAQYEESPYPRWKYSNYSEDIKFSAFKLINDEISPNSVSVDFKDKPIKILLAGCGTGLQIFGAQRYKNARITAVDLSSASLGYAKRKINQFGIYNVELIEMDILDVSLLEEKFDIIECGGVLHHMDDPEKGLKSLLSVLEPNGFIKLALYSELARKSIVKAIEFIKKYNFGSTDEGIRNFRKYIYENHISELKNLYNYNDFFSTSECRDLCFHIQEHRFTIPKLIEILSSNKLNFLGFLNSQHIKNLYKTNYPDDKSQTSLENWAKFEENFPNTFIEMYQFWVCKNKN